MLTRFFFLSQKLMIFIILLVFIYKIVKLKFAMVRLEIIVFTNGERYPILIDNGKIFHIIILLCGPHLF